MAYISIILLLVTTFVYVSNARNAYFFGSYKNGVSKELVSRQVTFIKPAIVKFNMDEEMDLTIHKVVVSFHNGEDGVCKLVSGGEGSKHIEFQITPTFSRSKNPKEEITVTFIVYGTYPEGKKPDLTATDITVPESAYVLRY